jgi:hypothetical protein
MLEVVITMVTVCIDNAILPYYLTSEDKLEVPLIRRTDPNISIGNNCNDDELYFVTPIVLATVPDCHFRSGSRSIPNSCKICFLGYQ